MVVLAMIVVGLVFWYFARRDLDARAVEARAPIMMEMDKLRATIEELTANLEQRAVTVERRVAVAEREVEKQVAVLNEALAMSAATGRKPPRKTADRDLAPAIPADLGVEPGHVLELRPDDRYVQISALLAEGVIESAEIARRTGLSRGEVELILSLRARHAL